MKHHLKTAFPSFRTTILICAIFGIGLSTPLHAGLWDRINESLLFRSLPGKGRLIEYQRAQEIQPLRSPLEVVRDGYKMIRVTQDFPDSYVVEWTWRVFLQNNSPRDVEYVLEYTLRDKDDFLVASSRDTLRRIAAGKSVIVEKTDHLPYKKAVLAVKGRGDIHLQN